MSDPRTKIERSRAKDIRQGIVEQRSVGSKGRSRSMAKPFRLTGSIWRWRDHLLGKYTTFQSAKQAYFAHKAKGYANLKLFDLEGQINMEDASPPKEYPDE